MTKIKSDGGSSAYYEILIPYSKVTAWDEDPENGMPENTIKVEVKDIIKYGMDNDFDRGNVFKALFRLGKKDGNDPLYDLNKCKFFIQEMIDDASQEGL